MGVNVAELRVHLIERLDQILHAIEIEGKFAQELPSESIDRQGDAVRNLRRLEGRRDELRYVLKKTA